MAIRGVIFDLGHTLMHLHGTWSEVFDRGVADLAAFCEQLLWTAEGGANREQALRWAMSNFSPGHALEAAYRSDVAWPAQRR